MLNWLRLITFVRGVRRQMAFCAAAQELGSVLTCPAEADFSDQYDELVQGFTDAAAQRQEVFSLKTQFDLLQSLRGDVRFLGIDSALPALNRAAASAAERLIDRAYQLCNHAELFSFQVYIESNEPSNYSSAQVADAMALCGTSITVQGSSTQGAATETLGVLALQPGLVNGNGRVARQDVTVLNIGNTALTLDLTGVVTHCSRVIGSPFGLSDIILRVGGTEMGRFVARLDGSFAPRLQFNTSELLTRLGRPSDSTEPIEIEMFRRTTTVNGCSNGNGGTFDFSLAERKIYTLRLSQPQSVAGTYVGTVTVSYQERQLTNFQVTVGPQRVLSQVFSSSLSTNLAGTGAMTARVVPGQPINFANLRLSAFSGDQSLLSTNRVDIGTTCARTISFSERHTLEIQGQHQFGLELRANAANGLFDVSGPASATGGTTKVASGSQTPTPASCGISPDEPPVTRSSFIFGSAEVAGTATIRTGVFSGSASGVVDLGSLLNNGDQTGAITGSATMTVTWFMTRQ